MAVCSLLHFLAGCPGWVLPTALLCGARTFLGGPLTQTDATVLPTHSGLDSSAAGPSPAASGAMEASYSPDSSVRMRMAPLSGQSTTSSAAARRISARSDSVSVTFKPIDTPRRSSAAPMP